MGFLDRYPAPLIGLTLQQGFIDEVFTPEGIAEQQIVPAELLCFAGRGYNAVISPKVTDGIVKHAAGVTGTKGECDFL